MCKGTFETMYAAPLRRFLFVCLGFIVLLKNFHSYGDVTSAGEGLQILTYARHSWLLNSEGSLSCHTYCETGHLRGPVKLTYCRAFGNGTVTTSFYDLGMLRLGFKDLAFCPLTRIFDDGVLHVNESCLL